MNILNSLQTLRKKAVKTAEKRNDVFLKRTENWQSSAVGALYDTETENLSDCIFKIDDAIAAAQQMSNPTI
jgi:hypothetical protein